MDEKIRRKNMFLTDNIAGKAFFVIFPVNIFLINKKKILIYVLFAHIE